MSKDDHTDDEQRNGDSLSKLLQRLQLPHIRAHYHELAQTAAEQGWGHLDYLKRLIELRRSSEPVQVYSSEVDR
jgi:DNA replication protein DnaC